MKNIKIIGINDIGNAANYINNGWGWCFIGANPTLREKVMGKLGGKNRYYYAEELQKLSIKIKQKFLDWLSEVSRMQSSDKMWWGTYIAYKNPQCSDLFLNYCFYYLVKEWVYKSTEKILVIVENPWLLSAIAKNINDKKAMIKVSPIYYWKNRLIHEMKAYKGLLAYTVFSIRMWLFESLVPSVFKKNKGALIRAGFDVLFCTWLEERAFKKDGTLDDPYIGKLVELYKKRGKRVGITTLPLFPHKLIDAAYQNNMIVPLTYFLSISDIFTAFLKGLMYRYNKNIPKSENDILDPLLEYEEFVDRGYANYGWLNYLLYRKAFGKSGFKTKILIYPFENQPWDKMMILALRESNPEIKIIGSHNFTIPYFYMNFFLGENESEILPAPDVIVTNGALWTKTLNEAKYGCNIVNGGSLRYLSSQGADIEFCEMKTGMISLVLLQTSLIYSLELLYYIIRNNSPQISYLIKAHPDTPESAIRRYIPELPSNFKFVNEPVAKLAEKASFAYHIGTTAALECMMKGVRVIKYLPERVDLDPLLNQAIEQNVISDGQFLELSENIKRNSDIDHNIIAEPFVESVWNNLLN